MNRKLATITATLLLAGTLTFAQDKPLPKEPTLADLKLQLAQDQVQIAQLKTELVAAQKQILEYYGQQAQSDLTAAKKAMQDAEPVKQETAKK